jgi:HK97 family phage major capsid protein
MNIFMQDIPKVINDLSPRERNNYSIARALLTEADHAAGLLASSSNAREEVARRASAARQGFTLPPEERSTLSAQSPRSLEHEISSSLKAQYPHRSQYGGLLVPLSLLPRMSGLDTKSNGSGAYTIAQNVYGSVLEAMAVSSSILSLGATMLTGLRGDEYFAVESSGSTGQWVSENPGSDATASDTVFAQKKMSPRAYTSMTSFSRQLLAQSSVGIDSYVNRRLGRSFADALDLAAINGSGTNNQPLGLLGTSDINVVSVGTNGGAATAALLGDVERLVAASNAPQSGLAWLTNPLQRQKLRALPSFTNSTESCWRDGRLLDVRAEVSSHVPANLTKGSSTDCSAIILAHWPSLIIGEFGGGMIELVVDPYAKKAQGLIEVAAFSMVDVLVSYPSAVGVIADAR